MRNTDAGISSRCEAPCGGTLPVEHTARLLTVEDHFQIKGRGLVVLPSPVHAGHPVAVITFTTTVLVRTPNGEQRLERVLFALSHFSLLGGGSRWQTEVVLPDATKDTVPIGSELYLRADDVRKLTVEPS